MSRHLLSLAMLLVLSACGSPASPDGGGSAIQSLVNSATPDIKVNGVTVQPGSTTNATVGSTVAYQINYTNSSGQVLHTGVAFVRDDGVERLATCGATGSGGGGGGFGSSTTIFMNDPIFTRGHTARVMLLGALGPGPTGPGQCLLQSSPGQVNHAAVQAERLLVTLAVQ
jgi:hypothetical protein